MGFIDRMCSRYAEKASTPEAKERLRSPLEHELIARLQALLGTEAEREPMRLSLRFSGLVQGVGFRWTNQSIARELHATGWVKNLADGTVAMELQGRPAQIIRHLDALHASYGRVGCRVWLEECVDCSVVFDEKDFEVRF